MAAMLAAPRVKWKDRFGKTAMHDPHHRAALPAAYSDG
jgi:hypothetical protein